MSFCHQIAFNSSSIYRVLNSKKVKKPQKVLTICRIEIIVVPLRRETNWLHIADRVCLW